MNDAFHREKPAQNDPVLNAAQLRQPGVFGADHLIAIDFSDEARLLDLRNLIAGKTDVLS